MGKILFLQFLIILFLYSFMGSSQNQSQVVGVGLVFEDNSCDLTEGTKSAIEDFVKEREGSKRVAVHVEIHPLTDSMAYDKNWMIMINCQLTELIYYLRTELACEKDIRVVYYESNYRMLELYERTGTRVEILLSYGGSY